MISFSSHIAKMDSPIWTYIIPVPDEAAKQLSRSRRVICRFDGQVKKHTSLMPSGDGSFFILLSKKEMAQLGLKTGDAIYVETEEDLSDYGTPMDEALQAVLDSDPEGAGFFEALPPGKKRTLIQMIGKIKNEALKIQRSVIILDHLKMTSGKVDYKLLQQQFRERKI
ncbi:YdeI/OmpD-associated family protein [Sinomicrobium soli]|uniref:YdeI/OmpD-associated family protein n=1 Tax=Sinomicrobium sp. N-1-3-6 TaxID=2219864 RepID=UPI000DCE8D70|nr:YdeI/OmpD-associated family protein [Sinomicrobium sp. N-1-3-6]RAV29456.1 hypothetical protein DN748_08105 [Sinomicrobium sp. N-1-3-6]